MKVVINTNWSMFQIPRNIATYLGLDPWTTLPEDRTNSGLVEWAERNGFKYNMVVREIPDGSYFYISVCENHETLFYSATPLKIAE
jgi:hypothetical protein